MCILSLFHLLILHNFTYVLYFICHPICEMQLFLPAQLCISCKLERSCYLQFHALWMNIFVLTWRYCCYIHDIHVYALTLMLGALWCLNMGLPTYWHVSCAFDIFFSWNLNLLMLKTEYSGFEGQYQACDELAPKVVGASAGMVLVV